MRNLNIDAITRRALLITLAGTPMIALSHGGLEHVRGTVAKISEGSVTVATTAGKTVEVLLDAGTTYARAGQPIRKSDLKVGDRVVIHAAEKGATLTAHTVEVGVSTSKKP
jgi:hypothetical protein